VSGLGSAPWGEFTLGVPLAQPEEDQPSLVVARRIDAATKRYILTDEGNFARMSATAQRVLLTVSFALQNMKTVDPASRAAAASGLRAALRVLTIGRSPAARLIDVRVTSPAPATTLIEVEFVDLLGDGSDPETVSLEVS
jgi:hypothetical protein